VGRISKKIDYLLKEDLIAINRYMIQKYSGDYEHLTDNILNPNSLSYLLDAVSGEVFGQELHPTIFEKAAAYAFYIIKDHIFNDGNKRTGIEAAFIFLLNNGKKIKERVSKDDIVNLGVNIENESMTLAGMAEWLEENSTRLR
jgi:death-on-curing protein